MIYIVNLNKSPKELHAPHYDMGIWLQNRLAGVCLSVHHCRACQLVYMGMWR